MKTLIIVAGAAALALAGGAAAKPGMGHGNPHGHGLDYGYQGPVGYGVGGCPPGLRNKGCMPPGQAKKLRIGQHYLQGYGSRYSFGQIPYDLRRRYDLDPRDRYYYDNGYLYQVDPRTMVVQQVVQALLGR
jgi:hypothetical protein